MFEENIAFSCGVILDPTLVLSPQIRTLGLQGLKLLFLRSSDQTDHCSAKSFKYTVLYTRKVKEKTLVINYNAL